MDPTNAFDGMLFHGRHLFEVVTFDSSRHALSEFGGVPVEQLDGSLESLDVLENRLMRHNQSGELYEPRIFTPLLRYVAEIIANRVDGIFEMHLDDDFHRVWVPWIRSADKKDGHARYYSLYYLYDALEEDHLLLRIVVDSAIRYSTRDPR